MLRSNLHKKLTKWDNFVGGNGGGSGDDQLLDAVIEGNCTEISSNAKKVKQYCFYCDQNLVSADFPLATEIGESAFAYCEQLTTANVSSATIIGQSAFDGCTRLKDINISSATEIGKYAFENCESITKLKCPNVIHIANEAILSCWKLESFILNKQCTLGSNNFGGTLIGDGTGHIYVPADLVDWYKTASKWSTYASQIRALEEYTVDGTVDGELDESKI